MATNRPARHEKTNPIYPLGNKANLVVLRTKWPVKPSSYWVNLRFYTEFPLQYDISGHNNSESGTIMVDNKDILL